MERQEFIVRLKSFRIFGLWRWNNGGGVGNDEIMDVTILVCDRGRVKVKVQVMVNEETSDEGGHPLGGDIIMYAEIPKDNGERELERKTMNDILSSFRRKGLQISKLWLQRSAKGVKFG